VMDDICVDVDEDADDHECRTIVVYTDACELGRLMSRPRAV
jgi:hypothetical protein